MGMEKIDFVWYLKHITPYALLGYLAGVGVYILMDKLYVALGIGMAHTMTMLPPAIPMVG